MKRNPISEASPPNKAVLVTAARVRFGLTLKGLVRAAARDGERSASWTWEACEPFPQTRMKSVTSQESGWSG